MPKSQNPSPRSNALLNRLEDLLLTAPASELAVASRKPEAVEDVRRIIEDKLAAAEARLSTRQSVAVRREPAPAMLDRGPGKRQAARAVFGKDKVSAQDKVEELISKLSGNRKESKRNKK